MHVAEMRQELKIWPLRLTSLGLGISFEGIQGPMLLNNTAVNYYGNFNPTISWVKIW